MSWGGTAIGALHTQMCDLCCIQALFSRTGLEITGYWTTIFTRFAAKKDIKILANQILASVLLVAIPYEWEETLQHTAIHCSTLQHIAPQGSILQHSAAHCTTQQHSSTLQHPATHCSTLQQTAPHRNTLQRTATHCNTKHTSRCHPTPVES